MSQSHFVYPIYQFATKSVQTVLNEQSTSILFKLNLIKSIIDFNQTVQSRSRMKAKIEGEQSQKALKGLPKPVQEFYKFHGIQLYGCEFPIELVETLYNKLAKKVYDGGEYFHILDNQEQDNFQVRALKALDAKSNVFIIDHALTFKYKQFRPTINSNPKLVPRLQNMLKYFQTPKKIQQTQADPEQPEKQPQMNESQEQENNDLKQLQLQDMNLDELSVMTFPPNLITLSLINNNIQSQQEIIKKLKALNLKVLWLNGNPVEDSPQLKAYINQHTKLQIYNSEFTTNCTDWGIKFTINRDHQQASTLLTEQIYKLDLDNRNIFNLDLDLFKAFTNLRWLSIQGHPITQEEDNTKLKRLISLIEMLQSLRYLYVDFHVEIMLFRAWKAKEMEHPQRWQFILINGHSLSMPEPTELEYQTDQVHKKIFKIANCYRLANTQQLDEQSIWYVMDELGSSISHSDSFNVKVIPFLYSSSNKLDDKVQAYSIMWPVAALTENTLLERDYLHSLKQNKQRSSRLCIWYQLPAKHYQQCLTHFNKRMQDLYKNAVAVTQQFYKKNAIAQKQYINRLNESQQLFLEKFKIYTDNQFFRKYLKVKGVEFVDDVEQANIIWSNGAIDENEWKQYSEKYYLNQFPYEACIVMKHNLADLVQSTFGNTSYLMRTYNLQTQLNVFIGDFQQRSQLGLDNLWILKPPNMARSMDMLITDQLSTIIKAMETGPKIAQKYISDPVLRKNMKVDLRYIILVKSIQPLTLYLYKKFWIRNSNNVYTTDNRYLDNYQTQFTVMNYGDVSDFKQILYTDFIKDFEEDYKPNKWTTIHEKLKKMLRSCFIACVEKYPEMQHDKSRAIYGIDVMIDRVEMEPKLLEITFSPDCKRACEYFPTFYDEVFETLFMQMPGENMERVI